jgi:AraC-like DNA-binding protein
VDWQIILGSDPPAPAVVDAREQGDLASLLSAFDELVEIEDKDKIVRRALELALQRIGLRRAGVFLFDEPRNLMLGTWGTDLAGTIVDEHHVMYEMGDSDREVFRRAEEGALFTVFDNCPIVDQRQAETVILGRGWVASTPIRTARSRIGMFFNDAGLTGAKVDDEKQARTAILCSLVAILLDVGRPRLGDEGAHGHDEGLRTASPSASHLPGPRAAGSRPPAAHPMVDRAVRMLAQDPSLGGKELAGRLDISVSRLARVFKEDMGMSLVEYRNQLRLDRFAVLVDGGGDNLLAAALAAGFGSYAQFHRVFRALRGTTPREYLRRRR